MNTPISFLNSYKTEYYMTDLGVYNYCNQPVTKKVCFDGNRSRHLIINGPCYVIKNFNIYEKRCTFAKFFHFFHDTIKKKSNFGSFLNQNESWCFSSTKTGGGDLKLSCLFYGVSLRII